MNKNFFKILFSFLILTSCSNFSLSSSNLNSSINISSNEELSENNSSTNNDITNTSLPNNNINGTISLYGLNDFHGSILENQDELGILKCATFFKNKRMEDNTLIINSGDMWQGSFESNVNRGKFLTEIMNNVKFDSFTLGNHEFDWGEDYIISNRYLQEGIDNYKTPFLGANIFNYDINTKTVLDHADKLCEQYVIRDLANGARVGIIGTISEDQITSINSIYSDKFSFVEPTNIIKNLSDELRMNYKCDVIILSSHASYSQINKTITNESPVSNKKYVDAVFCAHSHEYEEYVNNGVPFVQGASNGKSYSEIQLNLENGKVTLSSYSSHKDDNAKSIKNITSYDEEIVSIYNKYIDLSSKQSNEVLATMEGYLLKSCKKSYSVPKLVLNAVKEECDNQNINVDYLLTNQARDDLNPNDNQEITLGNIYKCLPFDNEIYILKVHGNNLKYVASSNEVLKNNNETFDVEKDYVIAIIDYLAFHRNKYRNYDKFPDAEVITSIKKNNEKYNYRDITIDYIKRHKNLKAIDYSSFSKNTIYEL